jgi:hypothetical protein
MKAHNFLPNKIRISRRLKRTPKTRNEDFKEPPLKFEQYSATMCSNC